MIHPLRDYQTKRTLTRLSRYRAGIKLAHGVRLGWYDARRVRLIAQRVHRDIRLGYLHEMTRSELGYHPAHQVLRLQAVSR